MIAVAALVAVASIVCYLGRHRQRTGQWPFAAAKPSESSERLTNGPTTDAAAAPTAEEQKTQKTAVRWD